MPSTEAFLQALFGSQNGAYRYYRLPSEAEWEAVGRGKGKWRHYAWPGDFDPLRSNTAETKLGVTTPVGVFPEGTKPDTRLQDLCGDVWEWTATPWSEAEAWDPSLGTVVAETHSAGLDTTICAKCLTQYIKQRRSARSA
jgi:formylglycine-generating enzyme required for sulfatase activity